MPVRDDSSTDEWTAAAEWHFFDYIAPISVKNRLFTLLFNAKSIIFAQNREFTVLPSRKSD